MAYNNRKQINWLLYKAERLVSALYMVTDLINSNDPLKWRIRKAGIVLLTEINKLAELAPSDRKRTLCSAGEAAAEILSLLEISVNAGLISRMNYTLLKKEFASTPLLLERIGKFEPTKSIGQIKGQYKGQYKGQTKSITDKRFLAYKGQNMTIIDKVKKDARKAQIKKIFADGQTLSFNEVSDIFRDFSPKMLQRDLNDLIKEGVLKRIGKKRWSRYSLANLP